MNILVTGATGFIGSHLCFELAHRGYRVFGLSHSGKTTNIENLLDNDSFSLHIGDIRDTTMLHKIIGENRIETVFHLAAQLPGNEDNANPVTGFDTNACGTLNLLNTACLHGVKTFVYASSMSVYSEPPQHLPANEQDMTQPSTIYGVAKLTGELCCHLYAQKMDAAIIRYGGVYGPGQRKSDAVSTFINRALENRPIPIDGDGRQSSDYIYIDDAVQGTILAWEKHRPGSTYNIGSGQETSVNELAKLIVGLTHSKSEIVHSERQVERPFRFYLDIARAKKSLGYSPRPLAEGLRLYLEQFKIEVEK